MRMALSTVLLVAVLAVAAVVFVGCPRHAAAYYLPGTVPVAYAVGQPLRVKVNSLSSERTQLPYDYYSLPFCTPEPGTEIERYPENVGEVLMGDVIKTSPYVFRMMKEERDPMKVCTVPPLTEKETSSLNKRIENDYHVNMILDNLPITMNDLNYDEGTVLRGVDVGENVHNTTGGGDSLEAIVYNHLVFNVLVHRVSSPKRKSIYAYDNFPNMVLPTSSSEDGSEEGDDEGDDWYMVVGFEVMPCSVDWNVFEDVKGVKRGEALPSIGHCRDFQHQQYVKEKVRVCRLFLAGGGCSCRFSQITRGAEREATVPFCCRCRHQHSTDSVPLVSSRSPCVTFLTSTYMCVACVLSRGPLNVNRRGNGQRLRSRTHTRYSSSSATPHGSRDGTRTSRCEARRCIGSGTRIESQIYTLSLSRPALHLRRRLLAPFGRSFVCRVVVSAAPTTCARPSPQPARGLTPSPHAYRTTLNRDWNAVPQHPQLNSGHLLLLRNHLPHPREDGAQGPQRRGGGGWRGHQAGYRLETCVRRRLPSAPELRGLRHRDRHGHPDPWREPRVHFPCDARLPLAGEPRRPALDGAHVLPHHVVL